MPFLSILWDDSHIWGLLAVRAAEAMELPYRLVSAKEVAGGLLQRECPSVLLVPGGNARHKAYSLGVHGLTGIRRYVQSGGCYIGFCGGAGLALTSRNEDESLNICPWHRGRFTDRMQHFMSGHLYMHLPRYCSDIACEALLPPENGPYALPDSLKLPVWWPGRFSPDAHEDITVLASYDKPADDFWLADLSIADFPPDTFSAWQDMYGLNLSPTFLAGQPCVIHGSFGKGSYILSYSHLETPDSPHANRWLAHMLRVLGGFETSGEPVPPWSLASVPIGWEDADLARMAQELDTMLHTGLRHGLLFERTPWLLGWRSGLPGASLNNVRASLGVIRERRPTEAAMAYWKRHKEAVRSACSLFCTACTQYLLSERLAQTLAKTLPDMLPTELLKDRRDALFGPPMAAGGLYREVMDPLDYLVFLQLAEESG